jgi:hypothetical protein
LTAEAAGLSLNRQPHVMNVDDVENRHPSLYIYVQDKAEQCIRSKKKLTMRLNYMERSTNRSNTRTIQANEKHAEERRRLRILGLCSCLLAARRKMLLTLLYITPSRMIGSNRDQDVGFGGACNVDGADRR